jgi:hypothetical protein
MKFFPQGRILTMAVLVTCPRLGGSGAPPDGRILNQGSLKGFFTKINPLSPCGMPEWG